MTGSDATPSDPTGVGHGSDQNGSKADIGRATTVITFWNLVSRLTGFVRVVATTAALGVTVLGDVYQRTNLVSNVLFELLAGGMLFSVLIPSFVQWLRTDDRNEVRRLASALAVRGTVVLGVLVAIGILFSDPIVSALTAGASADSRADQIALGRFLLIFILPQLVLYLIGAVSSALLQADHRFAATSLAPVLNNIVVTATMAAFAWMHDPADGLHLDRLETVVLGGGTLAGTAAMTVIPLWALRRAGLGLRVQWRFDGTGLGTLARRGMWGAGHVGLNQVLVMSTAFFAGWVDGGVIAYQTAFTFFLLPHALLAHPVFTALYPRLSRQGADGDRGAFAADLGRGLRSILFLLIPGAGLMAVAAPPALSVLSIGQLDAHGARVVALVLASYLAGIGGYSTFFLLTRASYALEDPKSPTMVNLGVTTATVAAMGASTQVWDGTALLIAFGVATSFFATAGSLVLHRLVSRRLDAEVPVLPTIIRSSIAAVPATAAAFGAASLIGWDGRLRGIGAAAISAGLGLVVHLSMLDLLRAEELPEWSKRFRRLSAPLRRLLVGRRGRHLVKAAVAIMLVGVVGGSLGFSRARAPQTEAGPPAIDRVVLFTVPGLTVDDVGEGVMPYLDSSAARGSIAFANVRTGGKTPNLIGSYASLGAGARVAGSEVIPMVFETDQVVGDGMTIGELLALSNGSEPPGELAVANIDQVRRSTNPNGNSPIGALADSTAVAGSRTALVATGLPARADGGGTMVPAAAAATSHNGFIGAGTIGEANLLTSIERGGSTVDVADPEAFAAAVHRAQETANLVVVDPGETARAVARSAEDDLIEELNDAGPVDDAASPNQLDPADDDSPDGDGDEATENPPEPVDHRLDALVRTDLVLEAIAGDLRPGTLLLVIGLADDGSPWPLTPVVATGPGVPHGYLDSGSTHRPGLVTLSDIAPTVLDTIGAEVPSTMIGQPLRYRMADSSWSEAKQLDELVANRASADRTMTTMFSRAGALVYLITVLLIFGKARSPGLLRRSIELFVLTFAAWPVSTYLVRIGTSLYSRGPISLALSWSFAAGIALLASRLKGHRLDPLLAISVTTVTVIVGDLLTGAHLQVGSYLGYMPHTAPRFVGLGNSGFAILAGSTVAAIGAWMARSKDRETTWWWCIGLATLVVIVDGAPWLGTDVGGILALVPVLGIMLWALRGNEVRLRTVAIAAAASVTVLALAVGLDALRAPEDRTHLARFFLQAGEDDNLLTMVRHKWDLNTASLRESLESWAVLVGTAIGLVIAVRSKAVKAMLPRRSPERITGLAIVAVGILGWLVNDSGVRVLALACVPLGPLLVLSVPGHNAPVDVVERPASDEGTPVEAGEGNYRD